MARAALGAGGTASPASRPLPVDLGSSLDKLMTASAPYISIVGWLRNDGYIDRYVEHIRHAVGLLARQLQRHAVPSEIILVEWNPPTDRPPMSSLLEGVVSGGSVSLRMIVVDGRYHRPLVGSAYKGMHSLNAANAGMRRARGRFIVPKALDTYFTDDIIERIARRQLDEDEAYRCDRYDVHLDSNDWLHWGETELFERMSENIVQHHARLTQSPYWGIRDLHTNACGDFMLMAARHWHAIRGFQDDPTVLCLDADSIALHAAAAHGVREVCWPDTCRVYKISHDHTFTQRVSQDWQSWQTGLERLLIGGITTGLAIELRILFDYPRRRMRGVDGILGPSVERNFVVKARRYAKNDTSLITNTDDWGLAGEPLIEHVLARAEWDTSQVAGAS
ncbi:MAG: hypothetical protein FJX11_04345 [Alphaproteobacteria bacterium]|nr:hypothetical protein [Alphaproteobacteria bacterium]